MVEFRLLGGLGVRDGDAVVDLGPPKQRAVLAVLLLEHDRVVSVERLVELLWGEEADKATASLQAYISRLRSVLEPQRRPRDPATVLVSQPPGYRLAVNRSQVDLFCFEDDVALGRDLLRAGRFGEAVTALDVALARWSGPLLPESAHESFVLGPAARADSLRTAAVEGAAEARLELGDHRAAALLVESEAAANPALERLSGLLALALYRSARQAEALSVIDRCRHALRERSGLDPGPELRRLEAEVLAHSPALDWCPPLEKERTQDGDDVRREFSPEASTVVPERRSPVLVGRSQESAVLTNSLSRAMTARGGLAVISGEPGIGKTHLAAWAVGAAAELGFTSAWARCPESRSAPPFWALTQISDQLLSNPGALDVAPADTFVRSRSLLDRLASALTPSLLVIDDLQWADPDTLHVLEHLAADLASTRTLLVVTTRPLAEGAPTSLVDCLAEFARVPGCVQVALRGLDVDDVARWLNARSGTAVPDDVASVVHGRAGGNPLFINEITELLAAEGSLGDIDAVRAARAIPPGVQYVVRRRVSRLPNSSQRLLSTAAVLGPTFALETLVTAAAIEHSAALDALGPALDVGLLVEAQGGFGFSHTVVAESLAVEMNAARRASIHAAAARSMAAAAPPGFGAQAAAVAHHAFEGILSGTGDLAIDAGRRAAEIATARLAHEDAAAHWANVALALGRSRPSDVNSRLDALIEQAASLTRADMLVPAKGPILAAIEEAEAAGAIDHMARAAMLVNHAHVWASPAYGEVNTPVVQALERTLGRLGDDDRDREQRAVILGALPSELVFADRDRHLAACDAAIGAARSTGDPLLIARALNNTMAPNRACEHSLRRERAQEMLDLHHEHGLPAELAYAGFHHRAECHLEMAEFEQVTATLEAGRRVLEEHGVPVPSQSLWFSATIALATGRYHEATGLCAEAYALHRRGRRYDADVLDIASRAAFAIDRGGFEAMLAIRGRAASVGASSRSVAESTAFCALEAGLVNLAGQIVASFSPAAVFADDYTTLFCATAALHVRVELGDKDGAASAAAVLAPYPDRWAGAGSAPFSMGFVGLGLARHAAFVGDVELAASRFSAAVAMAEREGAFGWLARSLVHQGRFLREAGDARAAQTALERAAELAVTHGLPYVMRRLETPPR